jgi:hypothetical protein
VEKRVVNMRRHGERELPGVDSCTSSYWGIAGIMMFEKK